MDIQDTIHAKVEAMPCAAGNRCKLLKQTPIPPFLTISKRRRDSGHCFFRRFALKRTLRVKTTTSNVCVMGSTSPRHKIPWELAAPAKMLACVARSLRRGPCRADDEEERANVEVHKRQLIFLSSYLTQMKPTTSEY